MSAADDPNIYSQYLSQFSADSDFKRFVAYWDRLERLVLLAYRSKAISGVVEAEWREVRGWLHDNYPRWQAPLAEIWPQTLVGGKLPQTDPFSQLLAANRIEDLVGKWSALQQLPAAREAINRYLKSRS